MELGVGLAEGLRVLDLCCIIWALWTENMSSFTSLCSASGFIYTRALPFCWGKCPSAFLCLLYLLSRPLKAALGCLPSLRISPALCPQTRAHGGACPFLAGLLATQPICRLSPPFPGAGPYLQPGWQVSHLPSLCPLWIPVSFPKPLNRSPRLTSALCIQQTRTEHLVLASSVVSFVSSLLSPFGLWHIPFDLHCCGPPVALHSCLMCRTLTPAWRCEHLLGADFRALDHRAITSPGYFVWPTVLGVARRTTLLALPPQTLLPSDFAVTVLPVCHIAL